MLNRAVFLDRDGTITEEVGYLNHIDELCFIDGAPAAIARLNKFKFNAVVVTNQAGVARGYFAESSVRRVHSAIEERLKVHNAHIDAFYYCPHHPTEGIGRYRVACHCRKPKPGMLERAARELQIDFNSSYVVGDKISDLAAGYAVGCRLILVRTGYGRESEEQFIGHNLQPHFIAADVQQAVKWILQDDAWKKQGCLVDLTGSQQ